MLRLTHTNDTTATAAKSPVPTSTNTTSSSSATKPSSSRRRLVSSSSSTSNNMNKQKQEEDWTTPILLNATRHHDPQQRIVTPSSPSMTLSSSSKTSSSHQQKQKQNAFLSALQDDFPLLSSKNNNHNHINNNSPQQPQRRHLLPPTTSSSLQRSRSIEVVPARTTHHHHHHHRSSDDVLLASPVNHQRTPQQQRRRSSYSGGMLENKNNNDNNMMMMPSTSLLSPNPNNTRRGNLENKRSTSGSRITAENNNNNVSSRSGHDPHHVCSGFEDSIVMTSSSPSPNHDTTNRRGNLEKKSSGSRVLATATTTASRNDDNNNSSNNNNVSGSRRNIGRPSSNLIMTPGGGGSTTPKMSMSRSKSHSLHTTSTTTTALSMEEERMFARTKSHSIDYTTTTNDFDATDLFTQWKQQQQQQSSLSPRQQRQESQQFHASFSSQGSSGGSSSNRGGARRRQQQQQFHSSFSSQGSSGSGGSRNPQRFNASISSHNSMGSVGSFWDSPGGDDPQKQNCPVAVPSTPVASSALHQIAADNNSSSRLPTLTLSARDTPSRRQLAVVQRTPMRSNSHQQIVPFPSTPSPGGKSRNLRSASSPVMTPGLRTPQIHNKVNMVSPASSSSSPRDMLFQRRQQQQNYKNSPTSDVPTLPMDQYRRMGPTPTTLTRSRSADRPCRPPLSVSTSSSSLDEKRIARRSRRPIRNTNVVTATAQQQPQRDHHSPVERLTPVEFLNRLPPERQKSSEEFLNYSFDFSSSNGLILDPDSDMNNMNYSSISHIVMDNDGEGVGTKEIATPAISRKMTPTTLPKFTIPESPIKTPRRFNQSTAAQQPQQQQQQQRQQQQLNSSSNGLRTLQEDESCESSTVVDTVASSSIPTTAPPTSGEYLYECARRCAWDKVAQECQANPWTAKYVCDEDGTTALHLAIISRANPIMRDGGGASKLQPAPLTLIEQLIIAAPEAAIIRCTAKRYTPLSYASLVADDGYNMDDSAAMIRIILRHNPHCALVFTDDGFSAVDIHIISYSRLHQERAEVYSNTGRSSTVVLRTLLDANPALAMVRSYGSRVRGPVELLYRCNLKEFKEASGADVVRLSKNRARNRQATSSGASTLCEWWAWKWALLLLEVASILEDDDTDESAPFSPVHAAAHLVGCPIPVLALAIDGFPELARTRNPRQGLNNCPLHEVCSWVTDDVAVNGDPFVVKRKRKAIAMLLEAFPKAARMTNSLGETPLQLAIETCTPWDSLEKLVKAFSKALAIPRNLEHIREESPIAKAVAYHNDDVGSVGSDEDEWDPEAIDAVEGMYPFMIAGVLSHVPDRRNYSDHLLSSDHDAHTKNLRDKDLESLRSIYGLLRAYPAALSLFIEDEKIREFQRQNQSSDEGSDCSEEETCTEAYVEDDVGAQSISEDEEDDVVSSDYTEEEIESCVMSDYSEIGEAVQNN